jgi:hypothetical protein
MTVQTTKTFEEYAGDASTVTFTLPFKFIEQGHLVASRVLTANPGTPEILTIVSVTGASLESGWSATLSAPVGVGYTLKIQRVTARLQPRPYPANDPFPSRAHEGGLDRLTMIVQELAEAEGATIPPVIGIPGNGIVQVIGGVTQTVDLSGTGGIVIAGPDGSISVPPVADVVDVIDEEVKSRIPVTKESFPASKIDWIEAASGELWNDGMCFCWLFPSLNYKSLEWLKTLFGGNAGVPSGKYSVWGFDSMHDVAPVKLHEASIPDSTGGTYLGFEDLSIDIEGYVMVGIAMDPGIYGPGQPITQASLIDNPTGPSPAVRPMAYLALHDHNTAFESWPEPIDGSAQYRIVRWMEVGLTYPGVVA